MAEHSIDFVYRNVLERDPDADGRVFWLGPLAAGVDRGERVVLDVSTMGSKRPISGPQAGVRSS